MLLPLREGKSDESPEWLRALVRQELIGRDEPCRVRSGLQGLKHRAFAASRYSNSRIGDKETVESVRFRFAGLKLSHTRTWVMKASSVAAHKGCARRLPTPAYRRALARSARPDSPDAIGN